VCDLITYSPPAYFHSRRPANFFYGYNIRGVACRQGGAAALEVAAAGQLVASSAPNGGTAGIVYGISVVPSLPTVSAGLAAAKGAGLGAGCLGPWLKTQ
jgi:hypothetical protein